MLEARSRRWNLWLLAALLAGCASEHPIAPPAAPPEYSWRLLSTGETFVELWGSSNTEVFAVGSAGTLLRYDGKQWTTMPHPEGSITAIWGTSARDFFIGTREHRGQLSVGTIYHYDGSDWEVQHTEYPGTINDIWGTSSRDVFAVGGAGLVLHYDGSGWTRVEVGTIQALSGVWGSSSTDVFVVGYEVTLHYGADGWTTSNTIGGSNVWGSSGTDVYTTGNCSVMHYDGAVWNPITTVDWGCELDVWGRSSSDVYISGERMGLYHYNGTTWEGMPTWMVPGGESDFFGIWGSVDGDLFIVGGGESNYSMSGAAILHYNGAEWESEALDVLRTGWFYVSAVGGCSPNDIFFAGEDKGLLHYDGSGPISGNFASVEGGWDALSAASPEAVFLVDRYYGDVTRSVGRWGGTEWHLGDWVLSVWAASDTEAIVVGSGGRIRHLDGVTWATRASGTTAWLGDVWGSSSTDAFAVGEAGTICHYDGSTWSAMPRVTSKSLRAVWGSSGQDVFAVGDAGAILHYAGSSWSSLEGVTEEDLTGVWCSSPSDVFVVGRNVVLHHDGTSWTRMNGLRGTRIWGSSRGDVYLIDGLRIFHYGI